MSRLLVATVLGLSSLLVSPGSAQAQFYGSSYNPYRSMYNGWNNSIPGYANGSSEYRRQIREMNPYGSSYRQYQRDYRGYYSR